MNTSRPFLATALLAVASTQVSAQDPVLSYDPPAPLELGAPFEIVVNGTPGDITYVVFGDHLSQWVTPFGTLDIDPVTGMFWGIGRIPASGELRYNCGSTACEFEMTKYVFYSQAVTFQTIKPIVVRGISEVVPMDFVTGDVCPPCAEDAPVDTKVWDCPTFPDSSFLLPGCPNERYRWVTPGVFTSFNDGTAVLTGGIEQVDNVGNRFQVDLLFSGRQSIVTNNGTFPPPLNPKLDCILPAALAQNGGPIDPTTWHYYLDITGTLTGKANFLGTNYDVTLRGPAAQVGFGAAIHNADYGLSAWLRFVRTSGTGGCGASIEGDVNINLTDCL